MAMKIQTLDSSEPTVHTPFMDASFDYSDSEEEDYNVNSPSQLESESEFESEPEVSDSEDFEAVLHVFTSDESEDDEDDQPFLIDYLCIASPPSEIQYVEAVSIEKEEICNSGMIGYTLCGDNIDKNVRRRYQRSDKTTISLHHFHMYAVKNRVDFTLESDDCLSCNLSADNKACLYSNAKL